MLSSLNPSPHIILNFQQKILDNIYFYIPAYFNSLKALLVTFSLSKNLIINSPIIVIINDIPYTINPNFQLPSAKYAPAIVDEITDGILANVDIKINLVGLIGSNPPI